MPGNKAIIKVLVWLAVLLAALAEAEATAAMGIASGARMAVTGAVVADGVGTMDIEWKRSRLANWQNQGVINLVNDSNVLLV